MLRECLAERLVRKRSSPASVLFRAGTHAAADGEHRVAEAAQEGGEKGIQLQAVAALAAHDNLVKEVVELNRHLVRRVVVDADILKGHARNVAEHQLLQATQRIGGMLGPGILDVRERPGELLFREGHLFFGEVR